MTVRFIDQMLRHYRRHGVAVRAVLSDNGPEYKAGDFAGPPGAKGLRHERIPARSPNHNAVCERFQGTMLQECWRPAFHRRHFTSIRQLQAEADAWLITYNHRRRNHGDYMRGRTPQEILDNHKRTRQHDNHQPQSPLLVGVVGDAACAFVAVHEIEPAQHQESVSACHQTPQRSMAASSKSSPRVASVRDLVRHPRNQNDDSGSTPVTGPSAVSASTSVCESPLLSAIRVEACTA